MIAGYQAQLQQLRSKVEKDTKKIQKQEQKLSVATKGYQIKLANKVNNCGAYGVTNQGDSNHPLVEALNKSRLDLHCFSQLYEKERSSHIPKRVQESLLLAQGYETSEQKLQQLYAEKVATA